MFTVELKTALPPLPVDCIVPELATMLTVAATPSETTPELLAPLAPT